MPARVAKGGIDDRPFVTAAAGGGYWYTRYPDPRQPDRHRRRRVDALNRAANWQALRRAAVPVQVWAGV